MVMVHNAFYEDLVQSDDYPPAKSGKMDQDEVIQVMIVKTEKWFIHMGFTNWVCEVTYRQAMSSNLRLSHFDVQTD